MLFNTFDSPEPRVFVSSVVYGLERERELVHQLVTARSWTCDVSGLSDDSFWGGSETACFKQVEQADLYIGVFKCRSGSFLFAERTFITEMELYHALNSRKPMRIYILDFPSEDPEKSLGVFLQYIQTELYVRTCRNTSEFKALLIADLETFSRHWQNNDTSALIPPMYLDRALRRLGVFSEELRVHGIPERRRRPIDYDFVQTRLSQMSTNYERHDFVQCAALGVPLFEAFSSLHISYKSAQDFIQQWASFLRMWTGSCTWLGYLDGEFGALKSSLLLKEACRMMKDWTAFYEADAVIANVYYVIGQQFQSIQMGLMTPEANVAKQAFRRALVFDERHAERTTQTFPHLHRAYAYLQLGLHDKAIEDFQRMLNYGSALDELRELDYSTSLGLSFVVKGLNEEKETYLKLGRSHLDSVTTRLEYLSSSPFYFPYMKRIAKAHLDLGDFEESEMILERLYPLAVSKRLGNQVESIRNLLIRVRHAQSSA